MVYALGVIDLLLRGFEVSLNLSVDRPPPDDLSLLASLHRHGFDAPALDFELADFNDVHLQVGALAILISFLDSLLRSDATDFRSPPANLTISFN